MAMSEFQRYMTLAAGSVAEAIMGDSGGGQDGNDWIVPQNRIEVIDEIEFVNLSLSPARIRVRRDATAPPVADPALVATDNIEGEVLLPSGAGGTIHLKSGIMCNGDDSADAAGTGFYMTVEQPDGAGAVSVTIRGRRGPETEFPAIVA